MVIYFKEGDAVAHVDNLDTRLEVIRVIKKLKKFTKKGANSVLIEQRMGIEGIECGWWGPDKRYYKNIFHSNSLIPWDIAQDGFIAVEKYVMDRAVKKQEEKGN